MDFIGFTYNKKHSERDFNIYRVSDNSRYSTNLAPTTEDNTAANDGADGQYLFATKFKQQQFNINFAFDKLTETKVRELRQWFNGRGEGELIFDEYPYKAYCVKVTGTPNIKTVCFIERGERIYKGEGSVIFTCWEPFARTPDWVWTKNSAGAFVPYDADGRLAANYTDNAYFNKDKWLKVSGLSAVLDVNHGELPAPFMWSLEGPIAIPQTIKVANASLSFGDEPGALAQNEKLVWDSKRGLVYKISNNTKTNYKYYGNAIAAIPADAKATASAGTVDFEYWYY